MIFPDDEYKYWDLGDYDIITPSKANLSKILNALILCRGKLHDSHSLECRDGEWKYNTRSCAVHFRVSIPTELKTKFEELTGYKLTAPPRIQIN
jgi:hypothetical protein